MKLQEQNEDQANQQYLGFWVDNQIYGIPISEVVQIIGVHKIISMPEYPDYAKGIINLRGEIIPVIDLRIRFGREELPYNERTCIVVVWIENKHFGFIVDAVDEVASVDKADIKQTPVITGEKTNNFVIGVVGVDQKVVLLVDSKKLIRREEIEKLSELI